MMRWALILVVGSLFAGCKSDEKKDVPEAPKTEAKADAKSAKTSDISDQELKKLSDSMKTEEDFEEQVDEEITTENLEAELTKLETEIEAASGEAPSAPQK